MAEELPDLELSRLAVTESDDEEVCLMMRKMKDSVLVPCGHAKFCFDCGNRCIHEFVGNAPTCPYCRQPVMSCMKFYS